MRSLMPFWPGATIYGQSPHRPIPLMTLPNDLVALIATVRHERKKRGLGHAPL